MTGRIVLVSSIIIAPLAWAGVLLFTRFVPPSSTMAFVVLFLLLGIALTCTFAPVAYGIGLRFITSRLYRATMSHALRQGVLLALVVILNLILLVLHSWNILAAFIILAAAVLVEVLSLARK
ncbi:MAG TPA: hypothetical protein DHW02_12550 [Ktedonobacter sp.]|nr:hypothetical protein [Ktedonobacter sp.]